MNNNPAEKNKNLSVHVLSVSIASLRRKCKLTAFLWCITSFPKQFYKTIISPLPLLAGVCSPLLGAISGRQHTSREFWQSVRQCELEVRSVKTFKCTAGDVTFNQVHPVLQLQCTCFLLEAKERRLFFSSRSHHLQTYYQSLLGKCICESAVLSVANNMPPTLNLTSNHCSGPNDHFNGTQTKQPELS